MLPTQFHNTQSNSNQLNTSSLKIGHHRSVDYPHPQPTVHQNITRQFIERILEMEKDFQEIKSRSSIFGSFPSQNLQKEQEQKLQILKDKLDKIRLNTKLATEENLKQLDVIYASMESSNKKDLMKKSFSEAIQYISKCYEEGITNYLCSKRKKSADLLEYIEKMARLVPIQEILCSEQELFFQYSNLCILCMSKKLGLLYPRSDEYENHFLDFIKLLNDAEAQINADVPEVKLVVSLLFKMREIYSQINDSIEISIEAVRKELSEMTKPRKGLIMNIPDPRSFPYFQDFSLVDDPVTETKKKSLNHILTEIINTERSFCSKLDLIVESSVFEALTKEKVIDSIEKECLLDGWKVLQQSSKKLITQLSDGNEDLQNRFQNLLIAFSSQNIENHLENLKLMVCGFITTDRMIKKIQYNEKGKQMLLGFNAVNKSDLIDIWIMPIQRPPRYILLLNELLKQMENGMLQKALVERVTYLQKWVAAINFFAPEFTR